VPPDGGWGWIVLLASFLSNVIVDGVCYTYSIFFNELLDYFGAGRGKTALVGALLPACYLLVGKPIGTGGLRKLGVRAQVAPIIRQNVPNFLGSRSLGGFT